MSFFGGNPATGPYAMSQQAVDPNKIAMADQELEMITDLFNRIANNCQSKCISDKYHDSELTKGESVCVDRCVAKYFAVNTQVGQKLATMNGQAPPS